MDDRGEKRATDIVKSCIDNRDYLLRDEDIVLEEALPDEVLIKISVCMNLHQVFKVFLYRVLNLENNFQFPPIFTKSTKNLRGQFFR